MKDEIECTRNIARADFLNKLSLFLRMFEGKKLNGMQMNKDLFGEMGESQREAFVLIIEHEELDLYFCVEWMCHSRGRESSLKRADHRPMINLCLMKYAI